MHPTYYVREEGHHSGDVSGHVVGKAWYESLCTMADPRKPSLHILAELPSYVLASMRYTLYDKHGATWLRGCGGHVLVSGTGDTN